MPKIGVTLQKSGEHWQVEYRDSTNRRRWRSLAYLGTRSNVSKRRAQAEADAIAMELGVDPRLRDRGTAPTLARWIDEYDDLRGPELAEKTRLAYQNTGSYLLDLFGPDIRCSTIGPEGADRWRAWLIGRGLADETVRGHCRRAFTMFKPLVRYNRIGSNPFEHLPKAVRASGEHGQVDESMIPKLIEACPSAGWRALIALTCYAGLRRGEAVSLRWSDVRFGAGRIVVTNHKTAKSTGQRTRDVLMEKSLEDILVECHEHAAAGVELVCDIGTDNIDKRVPKIIQQAGLEAYPKPLHSWRSWRSKSWKKQYPEYMVDAWLGHSAAVSRKHYNAIDESVYTGESEIVRLRRENEELRQKIEELLDLVGQRSTIATEGQHEPIATAVP